MDPNENGKQITSSKAYQEHIDELLAEGLLSEEFSFFKDWNIAEKLYTLKNEVITNNSPLTRQQLIRQINTRLYEFISSESYFYDKQLDIKVGNSWQTHRIDDMNLLIKALSIVCLQDTRCTIGPRQMKQICLRLIRYLTLYLHGETDVIQFDDFYLEKGEAYEGFHSKSAPRYRVTGLTLDEVKAKPELPKEIEELCYNLAGEDDDSLRTLLDMLAYTFMADEMLKMRNSLTLWFKDRKGDSGVSVLMALMTKVIGEFSTFKTNLNARGALTEQERYDSAHSLLTLVPDVCTTLDPITLIFIKTSLSSDGQSVRARYKMPEQILPLQSFIFSSDELLKVQEGAKNGSVERRFLFFEPAHTLDREGLDKPQEWFDALSDEKMIRQFRAFLVARALELVYKHDGFIHVSEQCIKLRKQWMYLDNSPEEFLDSVCAHDNLAAIEYKQAHELYLEYKKYCIENDLTVLSTMKFYVTVERKTGLMRKQCNINSILKKRGLSYIRTQESEPEIFNEGVRDVKDSYRVYLDENQPNRNSYFWVRW